MSLMKDIFNSKVQQADETIDSFVTDLRKTAINCELVP